ncbi:hypothetical protein PITCH_A780027 [uncultured Desulfobacterium sp.]|uniref:ASPIC/UnbV domain-containing protein n=1 Tax=uncultured Desulfobacterium sp. TaxID=201089 RepID=A0A445N2H0_9BACT|nr:hypothetical protein PITCH_A780027 [uncultured Desulfobacterium sp.]
MISLRTRPSVLLLFLCWAVSCFGTGCSYLKSLGPPAALKPSLCDQLVEQAQKLVWERRYQPALELLDDAHIPSDDCIGAVMLRGEIYYILEKWQEARAEFEKALCINPKNYNATVRLWYISSLEKGFDEKAKEELKNKSLEFLSAHPDDPDAVYAAVMGLEGVRAAAEKTMVIEQYCHIVKDPSLRDELAEQYFYDTLGAKGDELIEKARFFMQEFPSNRLRYDMTNIVLARRVNDGSKAVEAEAKEILKGQRNNRVLNYLCARAILNVNGDLDVAAKYIKRAIKAAVNPDPKDRYQFVDDKTWNRLMSETRAEYYAIYGRITALKGNSKCAAKLFIDGLKHSSRSQNLHLWYGEVLEHQGLSAEAMMHYRKAAELGGSPTADERMKGILNSTEVAFDPAEYYAVIERLPRFTDVTQKAGLEGVKSGRISWSDINMDGLPDVVTNGRNMFLNKGNDVFEDVTEKSGIRHEFASGGILADFDNDGLPDLIAFTSRNGPRLYINRGRLGGDPVFEDVTESALPPWRLNDAPTEAAACADVDGNGFVDIYLAGFERPGPERGRGAPDVFYLNTGNGRFVDATNRIKYSSEEAMCGRGASFADVNNDNRPDLFVANYRLDPDFLLINTGAKLGQQGFMYADMAEECGVRGHHYMGSYGHSIGGAWGYMDRDRPALFVASLAHPRLLGLSDTSALYLPSLEEKGFERHFEDMGLFYQETYSDPSFVDVDIDGDLDLFITSIYRGCPSVLYLNEGGKFRDIAWASGTRVLNGWGAAWADYDRDGDMDLAVSSEGVLKLLRNEAQSLHRNWIEVKIKGKRNPACYIGAKVMVADTEGKKAWLREITAGRGTGNQDEAIAHFGLGDEKGPFKITVTYPSGIKMVLDDVPSRKMVEVDEP